MFTEERCDEARAEIENVIERYPDVFCADTTGSDVDLHLPVLRAWVLIAVHDDANDPSIGATFRLVKRFQAEHETIGMLELCKMRILIGDPDAL
jgi:hypothetical protein